jgi:hypothetical protein
MIVKLSNVTLPGLPYTVQVDFPILTTHRLQYTS